jgi:hypothetical protein
LRVQLVSALADGGGLSSPSWRRLLDRVRREPFVPRFWHDTDGAGAFFERRSRPSIRTYRAAFVSLREFAVMGDEVTALIRATMADLLHLRQSVVARVLRVVAVQRVHTGVDGRRV